MTCPVTVRLGVYALGAADEAECLLVESHLAACQSCRAELERMQPLPALLARVPASLIRADSPTASRLGRERAAEAIRVRRTRAGKPSAPMARARPVHMRGIAAVAATAALGAAAGFWFAQPGANQNPAKVAPATVTLSGANPVTHVRVRVMLSATSWGTSIRLQASGLPLNQTCRLIVRSRSGATEIAGTWQAWAGGPMTIPASAGWRPADIASLQVATASRNLVTVTRPVTGVQQ
jgi:hypothetical protein